MTSMQLNQLLDTVQLEHHLQSFVEILPLSLHVEDADGHVLAEVMPAGTPTERAYADGGERPAGPPPSAEGTVRAPIEIHGECIGHVVGSLQDNNQMTLQTAKSAAQLAAQILATRAYKEHEVNSLSTELLHKYEEITLLFDLSQALGSIFDIPTICDIALEKALQAVPAAKAFVMLADEDSEQLSVVSARVDGLVGEKTPIGHGISGHVAASGKPLLLHEGESLPSGEATDTSRDAVLSVPLTLSIDQERERILGVITLAGRPSGEVFTAGDTKLLTTIATQVATAIHNSRLVEELRAAERVRQEMEIASNIQQSLLPDRPPQLEGVALAGRCVPAANVGGDYYDFVVGEAGQLSLLIADVSGHSVGSALMMAMARSILRREIAQGKSPAAILADTNTAMLDDLTNAELFITMFCAQYDPDTRRLTFANGGHNPPLLRCAADGQITGLDGEGLIIGILEDVVFEQHVVDLQRGDVLVLYTDGVVEARNAGGEQFGEAQLRNLLEKYGSALPHVLADRVYEAVHQHTEGAAQQDDVTLLVLKVKEK